ncbi:MAG: ABC transporter permease [Acholeplasmataceae bacterium]|nr:ABC transporter permease [Acholeplasmataceae bacterium]
MKKFKFLVRYGLKKRVGRKAFLIANIVISIMLIAIVNLPAIISLFGGGDDEIKNINIEIINQTNEGNLVTDLDALFNVANPETPFYIVNSLSIGDFNADAFWADSERDIVFHFTGTIDSPNIVIYSKYPEMNYIFTNQIELQIINYQIGNYIRPTFTPVLAPDYEDPNTGMMVGSIASLLILPMFILITMATQFVGVDIIEEKSTKAIETIIASVPSTIHFLSKITSSIFFVIIQGGLVLIYSIVAALIGGALSQAEALGLPTGGESLFAYLAEIIPNWPIVLIMALLFMLVGTLFYLVVAALFASMAVTQEDYQQFQSPLMLMLLAGFYIGMFAPMAGGDTFMKIMAFVPIFAPMVAPIAFASGVLSLGEAIIALAAVVIFFLGALYFVAPIYKVAILSYDQTKFFKRIKDTFKKAFQKNGKKVKKEEI